MNVSIPLVLPLLVSFECIVLEYFANIFFINLAVHDAGHLSIDLLPLILVDLPSLEGVHLDAVKAAKLLVVVETVATALVEVVLEGVVELDGDETSDRLLTKECASMRNY